MHHRGTVPAGRKPKHNPREVSTDALILGASASKEQRALLKLAELGFVDFCSALGVTLHPGQRVIARICYDRVPPHKLPREERELAKEIFGDVESVPAAALAVIALVCGARGGKSYVLCALRALWGALRRDMTQVVHGNIPVALIVAPTLALGLETFSYIEGAVRNHPALHGAIRASASGTLTLERGDGHLVRIEVLAATRGGAGVRGRWYTDAILDECAFFRDENSGVINDKDIYGAVSPRILPGGQVVLASTPWEQAGLFFELFRSNWGAPETCTVAHAPTLTLFDSPNTRAIVKREQEINPFNANREYFAIFASSGSEQFFSAGEIDACTQDYSLGEEPAPGVQVIAAADLGFRKDCSTLVIAHLNPETEERKIVEVVEMIPEPGAPLRPSEVITAFVKVCMKHGVQWVVGDRHYKDTVLEFLAEAEIGYIDAPAQPSEAYIKARALIREGLVILPKHERLHRQMRETKARMAPGGTINIINPRWSQGGHGDLVSALVLALWMSAGDTIPMPEPAPGTKEFIAREKESRRQKMQERAAQEQANLGPRWWDRKPKFNLGAKPRWAVNERIP